MQGTIVFCGEQIYGSVRQKKETNLGEKKEITTVPVIWIGSRTSRGTSAHNR